MPVSRYFLDWRRPLLARVVDFLLPKRSRGPVDLDGTLVLTSTRQAGRRLREAFARECAALGTAAVSVRVTTPNHFLEPLVGVDVAGQAAGLRALAALLLDADLGEFPGFFPVPPPEQDYPWAVRTATTLQNLRRDLADGGMQIEDVINTCGESLPEAERWHDLARIDAAFVQRLRDHGLTDAYGAAVQRSREAELPVGTRRLVLAALPDPPVLMVRALERLRATCDIQVLIHAPEDAADAFDDWGRPLPGYWCERQLDVPEPEERILVAGGPTDQARVVMDLISSFDGEEMSSEEDFGPADVAVGVPDRDVAPHLIAQFQNHGISAYDPAGIPLPDHPVFGLVQAFFRLARSRSYAGFADVLRHPDALKWICETTQTTPWNLLGAVDRFRGDCLPESLDDVMGRLPADSPEGSELGRRSHLADLASAAAAVGRLLDAFLGMEPTEAIRQLLVTIYSDCMLEPAQEKDRRFSVGAQALVAALEDCERAHRAGIRMSGPDGLSFVVHLLGQQVYYEERHEALVDLDGWLELPWNDARMLIVTGMNEGAVPDGKTDDWILPDAFRQRIGLRCDLTRLARDAYIMHSLIEARRDDGVTAFVVGKRSGSGDPLKPSRLLLRCPDGDLADRMESLFREPEDRRSGAAPSITFKLDVRPPEEAQRAFDAREHLSVTRFRDYLQCPFRFYLKHVLGMDAMDCQKSEMDASDFGTITHAALAALGRDSTIRASVKEEEVREFLLEQLDAVLTERYGAVHSLPIEVQTVVMRQRLAAAARVHVLDVAAGWEVCETEWPFDLPFHNGWKIRGTIDRIDRHSETGQWRVLDYKTSESAKDPKSEHLGAPPKAEGEPPPEYQLIEVADRRGKMGLRRWRDLQLPLYCLAWQQTAGSTAPVAAGYFALPRTPADTQISPWDIHVGLLRGAERCARGVLEDLTTRRFWPPAQRVAFDDFETLFVDDVEACVDVEAFVGACESWAASVGSEPGGATQLGFEAILGDSQ
ncbi:MAG: hypothetical protein HN742_38320 [Lentisphaerae bacterium]|jgi:ATP-dependent helicase/nuclease subunit B|nr:hypothetical protein [Lentisphaerota bacterium]MBT4817740.1 hypothetical protein [Lentisphaerota bacterium]MBT5609306.1 hypothetical protein [Lentisphaerota bacterium]MBT7059400.1 hypothetical protein [Lentisphaerota bacterium]MBT7847784.1 hypothetical protein [Lentisphaerota bacterium]